MANFQRGKKRVDNEKRMEEKKKNVFCKQKMKFSSPNSQSIISKNLLLLLLLFTLVVISED